MKYLSNARFFFFRTYSLDLNFSGARDDKRPLILGRSAAQRVAALFPIGGLDVEHLLLPNNLRGRLVAALVPPGLDG